MPRAFPITCAVLLLVIGTLVWWVQRETPSPVAPSPSVAVTTAAEPATTVASGRFTPDARTSRIAEILPDGKLAAPEIAEAARQLHTSETTPQQDLETLQSLLDFYRRANGGANPSGSENEEIVEQLRGKNAHRLAVLPPDLPATNGRGQLLDRWGTPYFFHAISRTVLETRTAGPDRKLWTKDDIALGRSEE